MAATCFRPESHSDEQAPGMQAPSAVEQHTLIETFTA